MASFTSVLGASAALLVAAASGCQNNGLSGCGGPIGENTAGERAEQRGLGLAPLTREELLDPETCAVCHPVHFREWQQSMHAYASDDPVFVAMNQRGQRETRGELGDFCVKCHAPMALREGLTRDGRNLAELPRKMKGVTCYFCHNATDVGPTHFNNSVVLANDETMRGGIADPLNPGVHGVAFDELFSDASPRSNLLCGSCHDVVNPRGTHVERTFEEYEASFFNLALRPQHQGGETCLGCHMRWKYSDFATVVPDEHLPVRRLHEHSWPGVDVPLSDWPGADDFRKRTECELSTSGAYIFAVQTDGHGMFVVQVESDAGHAQPSGSAQDRRMWLEFIAYDEQSRVLFKSGVIPDGEVEEKPRGTTGHDAALFMLRDRMFDDNDRETHDFWEAVRTSPRLIPATSNPQLRHYAEGRFQIPSRRQPARVEMRLKMRPMGIDVLRDLIGTGDLAPEVLQRLPTFTLWQTNVVWTPDKGRDWKPRPEALPIDCFRGDPALGRDAGVVERR